MSVIAGTVWRNKALIPGTPEIDNRFLVIRSLGDVVQYVSVGYDGTANEDPTTRDSASFLVDFELVPS